MEYFFFVLYFISFLNFFSFSLLTFPLELGVLGVVVCMVGKEFQPLDVQL